jgi:hypothetical protein
MDTYKIVRHFQDGSPQRRTIESGLSLEQAQAHCEDPETSATTCTLASRKRITHSRGFWFDGYYRE